MAEEGSQKPIKAFNLKIYEDETILEPTNGPHEITIVWMHGLGMEAINCVKFFLKGNSLRFPNARIVMPQAPKRFITIDQAPGMIGWFDIKDRGFIEPLDKAFNVQDIRDSADRLIKIVEREIKLLNGEGKRVFVGGMSQGAAMAEITGLQVKQKIGGVVAAAGYFFNITEISENNLDTPFVAFHGAKDFLVPWDIVKGPYEDLKKRKPNNTEVILLDYMGHDFDQEAIREKFREVIEKALKA